MREAYNVIVESVSFGVKIIIALLTFVFVIIAFIMAFSGQLWKSPFVFIFLIPIVSFVLSLAYYGFKWYQKEKIKKLKRCHEEAERQEKEKVRYVIIK